MAKLHAVLNKAIKSSLRSRTSVEVFKKSFGSVSGATDNVDVERLCAKAMGDVEHNIEVRGSLV